MLTTSAGSPNSAQCRVPSRSFDGNAGDLCGHPTPYCRHISVVALDISHKVDESAPHVHVNQPDSDPVANVQTAPSFDKLAFNRRMEHPDPCALVACSRDQRIECLANPIH